MKLLALTVIALLSTNLFAQETLPFSLSIDTSVCAPQADGGFVCDPATTEDFSVDLELTDPNHDETPWELTGESEKTVVYKEFTIFYGLSVQKTWSTVQNYYQIGLNVIVKKDGVIVKSSALNFASHDPLNFKGVLTAMTGLFPSADGSTSTSSFSLSLEKE